MALYLLCLTDVFMQNYLQWSTLLFKNNNSKIQKKYRLSTLLAIIILATIKSPNNDNNNVHTKET